MEPIIAPLLVAVFIWMAVLTYASIKLMNHIRSMHKFMYKDIQMNNVEEKFRCDIAKSYAELLDQVVWELEQFVDRRPDMEDPAALVKARDLRNSMNDSIGEYSKNMVPLLMGTYND